MARISSRVRKLTVAFSKRLAGMASTRWMTAAQAGSRSAAYRNSECTATSRALRVRMLLPRSCSR